MSGQFGIWQTCLQCTIRFLMSDTLKPTIPPTPHPAPLPPACLAWDLFPQSSSPSSYACLYHFPCLQIVVSPVLLVTCHTKLACQLLYLPCVETSLKP